MRHDLVILSQFWFVCFHSTIFLPQDPFSHETGVYLFSCVSECGWSLDSHDLRSFTSSKKNAKSDGETHYKTQSVFKCLSCDQSCTILFRHYTKRCCWEDLMPDRRQQQAQKKKKKSIHPLRLLSEPLAGIETCRWGKEKERRMWELPQTVCSFAL